MADTGAKAPATVADQGANWTNANNVKVEDGTYATVAHNAVLTAYYNTVILVDNGTQIGSDLANSTVLSNGTLAFTSFGSSSSSWDASLTPAILNTSTFGVDLAARFFTNVKSTLRCTNFGFNIPSGSTIDGLLCRIKAYYSQGRTATTAYFDFVELTVYYTEGAAPAGNPYYAFAQM
jgi:pantothenate kinase type III